MRPPSGEVIHWALQPAGGSSNYTDYAQIPQTTTDWAMFGGPASGIYICTGYVNWAAKAGGSRNLRLEVWNRNGTSADTLSYETYAMEVQPTANANFTNAFAFTFIMNDSNDAVLPHRGLPELRRRARHHLRAECGSTCSRRGDSWPISGRSSTWSRPEHHRGRHCGLIP